MASPLFATPKAVKSLRHYWKKTPSPEPAALAAELMGESDRAVIILAASLLDDALIVRLTQNLAVPTTPEQQEFVFRYDGPLGSFSARIDTAVMFGFIDPTTRNQLSDIREMRNACAHSTQPMSFDVPQLAAVAKRLFHPTGYTRLREQTAAGIKRGFVIEFLAINEILTHGSREAGLESLTQIMKDVLSALSP